MGKKANGIVIGCMAIAVLYPLDAHAYIDPGTGSILFQSLVAAFLAGAMTFRIWWGRLKAGIRTLLRIDSAAPEQDE